MQFRYCCTELSFMVAYVSMSRLLSVFLFLSCPSMFENQDCSSHFASGFEFLLVMLHWFSLHLSNVASPEA